MSEEDNYRIEARLGGAGLGPSPTTEQIQTLLMRQRTHEKLTRSGPTKAFAKVLGEQGGSQSDAHDDDVQIPGADADVDAHGPSVKRSPSPSQTSRAQLASAAQDTFANRPSARVRAPRSAPQQSAGTQAARTQASPVPNRPVGKAASPGAAAAPAGGGSGKVIIRG